MIEKQNILELFGADSRSYHSVIITCYSFDFVFFEERVLPRLRQAGMVNINVFVDASMYERQLCEVDSNQYHSMKAYSITPIKLNGAFHPKIILGIGKNNGFLAIGSGNLTNSGLSSNDEIWAAFHTSKGEGNSAPIIKKAYEYLMLLEKQAFGINKSKLAWITDNSGWFQELVNKTEVPEKIVHNNESIRLYSSLADISIVNNLLNVLPEHSPDKISIIAPYYNKDGHILKLLQETLKPRKMNVVVDDRFGTVPYKFMIDQHVDFHTWENVRTSSDSNSPRLHAKIFQIEYSDQSYLMIGSANCSKQALGTKTNFGINAEMVVLLQSDSKKDWLKELGIEIPEKGAYKIAAYKPDPKLESFNTAISFDNKIMHAELDHEELQLHLELGMTDIKSYSVKVENRDGSFINYSVKENKKFQSITLSSDNAVNCIKVSLSNMQDLRISNFALIHRIQILANTNPDVRRMRFQEIISNELLSDIDLIELLDYAQFVRPDAYGGGRTLATQKPQKEDNRTYNTIDEKEFNKNEAIPQPKSHGNSSNLSSLEDFLNNMTFGDIGRVQNEDVSESNERKALNLKSTGFSSSEEAVKYIPQLSFTEGKRLKGKLHRKLEDINKHTINTHKYLLSNLLDKIQPSIHIGIEDLQSMLVGTHLLFMKMDKEFVEERIKIIIKYKSISDLEQFEAERGIGLQRSEKQLDANFSEVVYTVDSAASDLLDERISKQPGIELVYKDDTPSILVSHEYFSPGPLYIGKKLQTSSIKGFLINTVCPFLLLVANGVEKFENYEKRKFTVYKNRLFYRLNFLIANVKWHHEESEIFRLMVLNIFYLFSPDESEQDIWKEFEEHKVKIILNEPKFSENFTNIKKLFTEYLEWRETYIINKEKLFRVIGNTMTGSVIFKRQYGFCLLSTKYSNSVNLITPLGTFNDENEKYEICNVLMGAKGIFF